MIRSHTIGMTREELERMACSLDGDALYVLDGKIDGFAPVSPFNPTPGEMGLRQSGFRGSIISTNFKK